MSVIYKYKLSVLISSGSAGEMQTLMYSILCFAILKDLIRLTVIKTVYIHYIYFLVEDHICSLFLKEIVGGVEED